jgi:hypothetical protein
MQAHIIRIYIHAYPCIHNIVIPTQQYMPAQHCLSRTCVHGLPMTKRRDDVDQGDNFIMSTGPFMPMAVRDMVQLT